MDILLNRARNPKIGLTFSREDSKEMIRYKLFKCRYEQRLKHGLDVSNDIFLTMSKPTK